MLKVGHVPDLHHVIFNIIDRIEVILYETFLIYAKNVIYQK